MGGSRLLIKHGLSSWANQRELNYHNEIQLSEEKYAGIEQWWRIAQDGRLDILPHLLRRGINLEGEGIEVGAGMCWLSAQVSRLPGVRRIHALDFSETILSAIAPGMIARLGGHPEKIQMHLGDFHDLSMFADGIMDFFLVDAALHHTNHLDRVLLEAWRVLKPGGILIAVNEPGVPPILTPLTRNLGSQDFGARERNLGVIENTYPEDVWSRYFQESGFRVEFIPFFHLRDSLKRKLVKYTPLTLLNGILFWFKVIVAYKIPLGQPES